MKEVERQRGEAKKIISTKKTQRNRKLTNERGRLANML